MPVTFHRRRRLRGLSAVTVFVTLPPGHEAVTNRPGYGPITVVSTQVRSFGGNVYQLNEPPHPGRVVRRRAGMLLASAGRPTPTTVRRTSSRSST